MGRHLGGKDVRHGMSRTRLYKLWVAMMNRCGHYKCSNPAALKYYVAKGVIVCDDWRTFMPFYQWASSHGYADGLTLDRIDSSGHYEPGNCQWVSMTTNLRKRAGVSLTMEKAREIRRRRASGERVADLAGAYGVRRMAIYKVLDGSRWSESAV